MQFGNYAWSTAGDDPMFRRWDARVSGASPLADYRNEPNQFGWVVEIDPYDPNSTPRKRTALGRMGHEGAWIGKLTPGRKLAVYMGDGARREYFYKFVSDAHWDPADAQAANRLATGDKYLDSGMLYIDLCRRTGHGGNAASFSGGSGRVRDHRCRQHAGRAHAVRGYPAPGRRRIGKFPNQ